MDKNIEGLVGILTGYEWLWMVMSGIQTAIILGFHMIFSGLEIRIDHSPTNKDVEKCI